MRSGPVDNQHLGQLASTLGIGRNEIVDSQWLSEWVVVLLRDADAVLAIEPVLDENGSNANLKIGIAGPYPEGSEYALEVRALFSDEQGELREYPVTGSLNGSLAHWFFATGRAKSPYVVSQGARVGRNGRLRVSMDADATVWVAGSTTICISGEVNI
jgi:predicted PhzF superfamily epimerase YddE/YHI9